MSATSVRTEDLLDPQQKDIDNLVRSVAHGMPADTIAPMVKERQSEIARLGVGLRDAATVKRPDIDKLRQALR